MMLTLYEVYEYMNCPLGYKFRHMDKIPCNPSLSSELSEAVHKVIKEYFVQAMESGTTPPISYLKESWEKTWFGETGLAYMLRQRDERVDAGFKGMRLLDNFYKSLPDSSLLAVGVEYELPFGKHVLRGSIDLVREVTSGPRKVVEIVDYRCGSQPGDQWLIDNDLGLALQSYAFRYLFRSVEDRVACHYLESTSPCYTVVTEAMRARAMQCVTEVIKAITDQVFFPRQSYLCRSCGFKTFCAAWGCTTHRRN